MVCGTDTFPLVIPFYQIQMKVVIEQLFVLLFSVLIQQARINMLLYSTFSDLFNERLRLLTTFFDTTYIKDRITTETRTKNPATSNNRN